MVKLLYIIGDGRSGSTLLNIALGNHPDAVAAGELCNVQRYLWRQDNWCSCGTPVHECSFWGAVSTMLGDARPDLDLQTRLERSGMLLEPQGFFSHQEHTLSYLCKFKGTLTPGQMQEDLVLAPAEDDRSYNRYNIVWFW